MSIFDAPRAVSLPVKHRPTRFDEVAGQSGATAVLAAAAAAHHPAQQLLLAGPSGTGKTTLARLYAAALFCPHAAAGQPCGHCEVCTSITGAHSTHPDVIELDAASHGGVESIRALAATTATSPLLADFKIYIIDEAQGLSTAGAQAFLRLLEEPPAHVIFALATTDPDKLPSALRGRCLNLDVAAPTHDQLVANLARVITAEGWQAPDPLVLDAVIAASDPALGVRGTVATLAKIAPLLATGSTTDVGTVVALLGVASPAALSALSAAMLAGDTVTAVRICDELVSAYAAEAIRASLLRTLGAAVVPTAGSAENLERLLGVFRTIASAPPGAAALVVAVGAACLGASPAQAPPTTGNSATSTPPDQMTVPPAPDESGQPTTTVAGPAGTHGQDPPGSPRPEHRSPQPGTTQPLTSAPTTTAARPRRRTSGQPAESAPPGADTPAAQPVLSVPEVLNALAKASPRVAVAVRKAGITVDGSTIVVPAQALSPAHLSAVERVAHGFSATVAQR